MRQRDTVFPLSREMLIIIFLTVAALYAFWLTHGTFNLSKPEPRSHLYLHMWEQLKRWEFSMDEGSVLDEAFYVNGKITTYYGVFPAVLRGIFPIFLPGMRTDWARLSCLLAAFLAAISFFGSAIIAGVRRHPNGPTLDPIAVPFALAFIFATPIIVLLSASYSYHEPILWGLAWTGVYFFLFMRFFSGAVQNAWLIGGMSFAAGAALHSRPSAGLALYVTHGLLLVHGTLFHRPRLSFARCTLFGFAPLALFLLVAFHINQARWGNPFVFSQPWTNTQYVEPDRVTPNHRGRHVLERGVMNPDRIPSAINYYFIPAAGNFTPQFPFLRYSLDGMDRLGDSEALFDYREDKRLPITLFSPFLVVFGVLGAIVLCVRLPRSGGALTLPAILLTGTFVELAAILSLHALCARYQADLFPFLAASCLAFVMWVASSTLRPWIRRATLALSLVLCLLSAYLTFQAMNLMKAALKSPLW